MRALPLLIASLIALGSSSAAAWRIVPIGPPCDVYVPSGHATVQQGVDAVCNGGRVHVAAGTFSGNVVVTGKAVHIRGAGDGTTTLTASSGAVVAFATGASGSVVDLAIRGGSSGVEGRRRWTYDPWAGFTLGAPPGVLTVRGVTISASQRGVRGDFSSLSLEDTRIYSPSYEGVLVDNAWFVQLWDVVVYQAGLWDARRAAVRVRDGGYWASTSLQVDGGWFYGNQGPGLRADRVDSVIVSDAYLASHGTTNIDLRDVASFHVGYSNVIAASPDADGRFGVGVLASRSQGTLLQNHLSNNATAGVLALGCADRRSFVALQNNVLNGNGFDLAEGEAWLSPDDDGATAITCQQQGDGAGFDDLGGNLCDGGVCNSQPADGELTPVAP